MVTLFTGMVVLVTLDRVVRDKEGGGMGWSRSGVVSKVSCLVKGCCTGKKGDQDEQVVTRGVG